MNKKVKQMMVVVLLMFLIDRAEATEFEKLGNALANALETKQVLQKNFKDDKNKDHTVYYSKGASGEPARFAFIEKAIYNPGSCSHTWVIGINATTQAVEKIRTVELGCIHAHKTKEDSYVSRYYGKGPADMKKLKEKITTIAQATGSCDLLTEAVQRSIENAVVARTKF